MFTWDVSRARACKNPSCTSSSLAADTNVTTAWYQSNVPRVYTIISKHFLYDNVIVRTKNINVHKVFSSKVFLWTYMTWQITKQLKPLSKKRFACKCNLQSSGLRLNSNVQFVFDGFIKYLR